MPLPPEETVGADFVNRRLGVCFITVTAGVETTGGFPGSEGVIVAVLETLPVTLEANVPLMVT